MLEAGAVCTEPLHRPNDSLLSRPDTLHTLTADSPMDTDRGSTPTSSILGIRNDRAANRGRRTVVRLVASVPRVNGVDLDRDLAKADFREGLLAYGLIDGWVVLDAGVDATPINAWSSNILCSIA